MKKTRIVKYNVDFWELASRVTWNESALCNWYFRGLPLWLCMEVLRGGKPDTLAALHLKAQDADQIYWMKEEESHLESKSWAPPVTHTRKIPTNPLHSLLLPIPNPLPISIHPPLRLPNPLTSAPRKTNPKTLSPIN